MHPRRRRVMTTTPPLNYGWQHNGTWSFVGGRFVNTPSLGSELFSNVEFATNTTGWTALNAATLTRRDYTSSPNIAPTGGSDDFGLEIASGGTISAAAQQAPAVVAGTWYQFSARVYSPSANTALNPAGLLFNGVPFTLRVTQSEDLWQTLKITARFTGTSGDFRLRCNSATNGDLAHLDAPSAKALTLNQLMAVKTGLANPASVKATGLIVGCNTAGVIYGLDSIASPTTFILATHDGQSNCLLIKYVSGTITTLLTQSATYVGGYPEIRYTGSNTYQLWYAGVQRGADQTIADAGTGTLHGVFSTGAENYVTGFVAQ